MTAFEEKKSFHITSSSDEAESLVIRRRSEQSHQAILQASLDILEREGYHALTIEAIAAKAGVGKQTIYRWWPSKAAVVLEAFTAQAATDIPLPNFHSLRADVQALLETAFQLLNTQTGQIVRGLIAEAQFDPIFGKELRDTFITARREALITLFKRGMQRGELPQKSDLDFLADVIYGPMWYRLLNQHAPLDASFAQQLVDFVLRHETQ